MKKVFLFLCKSLLFVMAVLLVSELGLRTVYFFSLSPVERAEKKAQMDLYVRLYQRWLDVDQKDPFMPPYQVYADDRLHDENRLNLIFEKTKLSPNQTWTSYDFLRSDEVKEQTRYTIHSNSLGFRGTQEYKIEKPAKTYRIIALGDYHTFGHGVEDQEAYPAQLEKLLNESSLKSKTKEHFEVWNGGRHAGTAIIALARLKHEILNYHPDLLLLDYGFVDPTVVEDNFLAAVFRFPDWPGSYFIKKTLSAAVPLLGHSFLWHRVSVFFIEKQLRFNSENFTKAMQEIVSIAKQNHIPYIIVKSYENVLTKEAYKGVIDDPSEFVSVLRTFIENPNETDPLARKSWIEELDPLVCQGNRCAFWRYRTDIYQLSPLGHRVVAQKIFEKVKALRGL